MGYQLKKSEVHPVGLAETNYQEENGYKEDYIEESWEIEEALNSQDDLAKDSEESASIDVPVLRRAAMNFLARREHSYQELLHKLQRKFPDTPEQMLTDVMDALAEENLQSDERFTESWVRYRQSRGFGFHHIRSDLKERGISTSLMEKYLFSDDDCWTETAITLINKRLVESERVEFGSSLHMKLQRYLESRGFGSKEIRHAIDPWLTTH